MSRIKNCSWMWSRNMRSLADSLQAVAAALGQSAPEDTAAPAPAPGNGSYSGSCRSAAQGHHAGGGSGGAADKSTMVHDQVRACSRNMGEKLSGVDPTTTRSAEGCGGAGQWLPNSHHPLRQQFPPLMNCTPSARLEREFADRETEPLPKARRPRPANTSSPRSEMPPQAGVQVLL